MKSHIMELKVLTILYRLLSSSFDLHNFKLRYIGLI
jgi:hypothetical protein